jgi:hypothetical protein
LKKSASGVANQIDPDEEDIMEKSIAVSIIANRFLAKLKRKREQKLQKDTMDVEENTN